MLNYLFPGKQGLSTHSIFRENAEVKLLFAYRGAMNEEITEGILGISENTLEDHTSMAPANRKVSFLLVECFQNILRHRERSEYEPTKDAMFSFRSFDEAFYINSINAVAHNDMKKLTEKVELVNSLDRNELKELYRKQLSQSEFSERGGAGLGLIELARKSGQPIRYSFNSDPDGIVEFHNQVSFRKDQASEQNFSLQASKLRRLMEKENILLLYKGDLSQRSIMPLLAMAEINTGGQKRSMMARKVGHVLVEMLQNISRHASPINGLREGVMTISAHDDGYIIRTGNVITPAQMAALRKNLQEIEACDHQQLRELHREKFRDSLNREDKYSSGLGLVQIARDGKGRIDYRFDPVHNQGVFFSLAVMV